MRHTTKLKIGARVKAIENHPYLNVTKRHTGMVVEQVANARYEGISVEVKFKHLPRTILFQKEELRKADYHE